MLIGGVDDDGIPSLYVTGDFCISWVICQDPSGTMIRFDAKGMGAAEEGILSLLKEKYKKELSIAEGEIIAMKILKEVMQDKVTCSRFLHLSDKREELRVISHPRFQ